MNDDSVPSIDRRTRTEKDLLGFREIPADAYWGIHTLRAIENFAITGVPIGRLPNLIKAFAAVKAAAARANYQLEELDETRFEAITAACCDIAQGELSDQFLVDAVQGGAGTSTNMNFNEVIANLALEKRGEPKGTYDVIHPNDHVNLSQSTNDAYPTAIRIALAYSVTDLESALDGLEEALRGKAVEFRAILKMGRTQLQDAVPMTLGQEFGAFATTVKRDREHLKSAAAELNTINLGATAIGTKLNTPPGYADVVCEALRSLTKLPLRTAPDLIEATSDCGAFLNLSSTLKSVAVRLGKMCNDLRLLSSGPRAGLADISLPAVQAGSSIMPGKTNPVIPETLNQVAFQIVGYDLTVTMAVESGQLQLNAFEPVIFHTLSLGLSQLTEAVRALTQRCIVGITPNVEKLSRDVEGSIGLITALNPYIGYTAASELAEQARTTGKGVTELVLEMRLLTPQQLAAILLPESLTHGRA